MVTIAGRGPAPKQTRSRERDQQKRDESRTALESDGKLHGPPLPRGVLDEPWHSRTVAWWRTWRESPQAQTFTGTDWDFLLDTALMHHTMWSKGRWEFAAELRLRAAKFGATPEDRMRLRIEVAAPAKPEPAKSSGASARATKSRRERLLHAVDDGD